MVQSSSAGDHASIGASVCTIDGKELGRVKDVRGKYIKVDSPHHRDFWLSVSTIRGSDDEAVHLGFDAVAIQAFMLDEPVDFAAGPDSADPTMDERVDARRDADDQVHRRENLVDGRDDDRSPGQS